MSLVHPKTDKELYVQAIRLHMEKLFGGDLKSVYINNVDFKSPYSEETFKIDLIRFQHHFPIKLPMKSLPYLDVFIDPVSQNPRITLFGEQTFTADLDEPLPPEQLEHLFVSLIWGAEITKKGIKAPVQNIILQ